MAAPSTTTTTTTTLPSPQFTFSSNQGTRTYLGPPSSSLVLDQPDLSRGGQFEYDPAGNHLAICSENTVHVYQAASPASGPIATLFIKGVVEIEWSSTGKYLATWARYVKGEDSETNPHQNLVVYELPSGSPVLSLTQKLQTTKGNYFQWSGNDAWAGRLVTNEVQFYATKDFIASSNARPTPDRRLKLDGVVDFSIAPLTADSIHAAPVVVAFVPERKGIPGSVKLMSLDALDTVIVSKSFYKADSVTFLWNRSGKTLLALTHTDVDTSGKSYYGETHLYCIASDGSFDCLVTLDKTGPIHDVAWSPNGLEFIAVYGTMPSKATLFNATKAEPIFELGTAARNAVKYNGHGRLFYIAGFGNLAGDVDIWDRKSLTKVTTIRASNASQCEWSPDSRQLLTCTLYRRLKVDNGIKIWDYTGPLMQEVDVPACYQVQWRPQSATYWPERTLTAPVVAPALAVQPPKPTGVYRPPGARGGAPSNIFRDLENGTSSSTGNIPGAGGRRGNKGGNRNAGRPATAATTSVVPSSSGASTAPKYVSANQGAIEIEKKMKVISKKLKKIAEIKGKHERGEPLELTQLSSLANEPTLLDEFAKLQISLESAGSNPP